jgi:hypothetical protein
MRLAVALLLLVGVVHFGYDLIALAYLDPGAAAKAWFYMLRGIEGVALFAFIAALHRHKAVIAVCALGMFEEGLTTACRASKPIGGVIGYEPFSGLCGRERYWLGLGLLGLVALGLAYELGRALNAKR